MLGRRLGLAIAATALAAGTLTGMQRSLCCVISSNTKALYLWAEYKMLLGSRDSALMLLQESASQNRRRQAAKPSQPSQAAEDQRQTCPTISDTAPMMF